MPNGEAEVPYDVAGWTLPLQMGVEDVRGLADHEISNSIETTLKRSKISIRRAPF